MSGPEKIERTSAEAPLIEQLRALFPEVITDGRVDVERLRTVLGDASDDERDGEHYGLRWPGKARARRLAAQPPSVTLRPVPGAGVDEDTTKNAVIIGDNLQVLLALQKSYANSVKLVYIDPPYNTGKDFIYRDSFTVEETLYLEESRQADILGRLQSNPETSGRFHSNWLSFMLPRLVVARGLMCDGGFIAVSINDVECAQLRLLMDEVFGAGCFVECFIWESIFRPSNMSKRVRKNAEYVMVYSKSSDIDFELVERLQDPQGDASLTQNNNKERTLNFPAGSLSCTCDPGRYPAGTYGAIRLRDVLIVEGGRNVSPFVVEGKFKWSQDYLNEEIAKGVTLKLKGNSLIPYYRKDYQQTALRPTKILPNDLVGDVLAANAELVKLGLEGVFDYPKPTTLIEFILEAFAVPADALVVDFFAGSGTTAQAVMQANAKKGLHRRFVVVQIDAAIDRETLSGQAALSRGFNHIAQITCARITRAAKALESKKGLDVGFRVYRETTPLFAGRPQGISQSKVQLDLFGAGGRAFEQRLSDSFVEVLLYLGFPLDTAAEQLPPATANTLWRFTHPRVPQPMILCLDGQLDDALVDHLPMHPNHTFVCRDESLSDVLKLRLDDVLRRAGSTFKVL